MINDFFFFILLFLSFFKKLFSSSLVIGSLGEDSSSSFESPITISIKLGLFLFSRLVMSASVSVSICNSHVDKSSPVKKGCFKT